MQGDRFKKILRLGGWLVLAVSFVVLGAESGISWDNEGIEAEDRLTAMEWALMEAEVSTFSEMERVLSSFETTSKPVPTRQYQTSPESEKSSSRLEVMEQVLNSVDRQREEAMKRTLSQFEKGPFKPEKSKKVGREKRRKEEVSKERGKGETEESIEEVRKPVYRISLEGRDRAKPIDLELDASGAVIVEFPSQVRQVVVVDDGLVNYEKLSPTELKFTAKAGLGSTVVYVWDELGRWLFHLKVVMPKIIKRIERLAREKKEKEERLKFAYSADWWSFHAGEDFGSTHRTDLGFIQTFSLYGPTAYGNLNASVSVEKDDDSYVANYRFVSLSNMRRWGLKDASITLGDYFAKVSSLTFPGSTLDGVRFSEKRDQFYGMAFYGTTEDYWNYVPLINQEEATVKGVKLGYKNVFFNYVTRSDVAPSDGDRTVAENAVSVDWNTDIGNWKFSGEVGYDEEKWAGLVSVSGDVGGWYTTVLLKDVEPGYRTISGVPVHSGEFGAEVSLDRFTKKDRYRAYLNVFRDKEYPNPEDPKRYNIEASFDWRRSKDSSSYGLSLDYNDYTGSSSAFKNYQIEGVWQKSFDLFKLPFLWSITLSHSDNRDKVLGRKYLVERVSNRFDWSIIPGLASVYSSLDFGRVEEKGGRTTYPRVIETGLNLNKTVGGSNWSVSTGYRYESHGGVPYSFSSNQDMFFFSGRLDWSLGEGRSVFLESDLKKYYPEGEPSYVRVEFYAGMKWTWDTGLNLMPKTHVWGYVFEDKNDNGRLDEGEPGLAGVEVRVDDVVKKTDANGRYDLGWIRGEKLWVEVNGADLPLGTFPIRSKVLVDPARGKDQRIDFPVSYVTGIRVVVFLDKNGNGKLDLDDQPVDGVKICGDGQCRYTDIQGMVNLVRLKPGQYTLRLDPTTLPPGLLPTVPLHYQVTLKKGQELLWRVPLRPSR